ncbi:MAG: peptidoglycan-binding domain-containing protein [Archangium sp.]
MLKAVAKPVDGFERKSPVVQTLQRGMTGSAVSSLQQKLVAAKFMSIGDYRSGPGVYGPRTEAAVARLQEQVGLPATGIANAKTQAALAGGARWQPETPTMTMPINLTAVRARLSQTFADDVTQPIAVPLGA